MSKHERKRERESEKGAPWWFLLARSFTRVSENAIVYTRSHRLRLRVLFALLPLPSAESRVIDAAAAIHFGPAEDRGT